MSCCVPDHPRIRRVEEKVQSETMIKVNNVAHDKGIRHGTFCYQLVYCARDQNELTDFLISMIMMSFSKSRSAILGRARYSKELGLRGFHHSIPILEME